MRAALVVALVVLACGGAAAAWLRWAPRRVPDGQPPLRVIAAAGVEELRSAFNSASGETRILVLASPT